MRYRVVAPLSVLFLLLVPTVVGAQSTFDWLGSNRPLTHRLAAEFAVTAFVGVVVLGLFPDWGRQAVRTGRHSTLFSFVVGIPGILVFTTLWLASLLMIATIVGVIVGIPLAVVVLVVEIVWGTVGYIVVGTVLSARLGKDNRWAGLVVGALLSASLVAIPYLGFGLGLAISILGIGASFRVTFGAGGVGERERTVPPAHRT